MANTSGSAFGGTGVCADEATSLRKRRFRESMMRNVRDAEQTWSRLYVVEAKAESDRPPYLE